MSFYLLSQHPYSIFKIINFRVLFNLKNRKLRLFLTLIPLPQKFLKFFEKVFALAQGKGWGYSTIAIEVDTCLSLLRKKPKIFIDIGANKGLYTKYLLSKLDYIECHLFEPSKYNSQILKDSFSSKGKVKINELGLSNVNSRTKLFSDKSGSTLASLTKRRLEHLDIEMLFEEEVVIKRFDNYWENKDNLIDYVKIDVEGHELDVLEGFGELIKNTKLIQFEFGGCNIDTKTFFQDFWYFFTQNDFDIFRITPKGFIQIKNYSEQDEYFITTNYIALNKKFIK